MKIRNVLVIPFLLLVLTAVSCGNSKSRNDRTETCRYGPLKGSCKQCTVHCYAPAQREKIRAVMRYAGPRMLLYHPLEALRHLLR